MACKSGVYPFCKLKLHKKKIRICKAAILYSIIMQWTTKEMKMQLQVLQG